MKPLKTTLIASGLLAATLFLSGCDRHSTVVQRSGGKEVGRWTTDGGVWTDNGIYHFRDTNGKDHKISGDVTVTNNHN
jgi:hypothetical protein